MKKLNPAIIEEGSKLLDVGTYAEFVLFVTKHLHNEEARTKLLEEIQKFLRNDSRGKAIALWRAVAAGWTEPELDEGKTIARQMLKAGDVTKLTLAENRRAELVFAALSSTLLVEGETGKFDEAAEFYFALSVLVAKKYGAVAKDLGVKLP